MATNTPKTPNPRLAKSLAALRSQINKDYPKRDKESDGWIGDLAHQGRPSDHNPNAAGVVTAIDIDRDLAPGVDLKPIVTRLFLGKDPRIKYLIFERRITVPGLTGWKPYDGPNAHDRHLHISVNKDPKHYDGAAAWDLGETLTGPPIAPGTTPGPAGIVRQGDRGEKVVQVQRRLARLGFLRVNQVDGIFGPRTFAAVKSFQRKHNLPIPKLSNRLKVDGVAGPLTRKAMGI